MSGARPEMLAGWKEIAAYAGVSKSTLKRWADKAAFPLRRTMDRGMVYAFPKEVNEWWKNKDEPK